MRADDRRYKPGPAFDLEEAQRHVAQGRFALGERRAKVFLLEECEGFRQHVRPAAQAIFAALSSSCFVEQWRTPDDRFDIYSVELMDAQVEAAQIKATRWFVKLKVQNDADRSPVYVLSMHPAEHWPVETQSDLARRRAR